VTFGKEKIITIRVIEIARMNIKEFLIKEDHEVSAGQ
jgi:hypothetical protein